MGNKAVDETKHALRRRFRTIRKELGEEARAAADAGIESRVLALPEFVQAEVLLSYLDFGSEVRTRGIIEAAWAAGKVVALPWCVPGTHQMRWYRVSSFDALVRSGLGVGEPVPDDVSEQLLGTGQRMLALVPGLTFDAAGYRLGYGGGFYDTFLAGFDGVSVGLCREAQMSDDLQLAGVVDEHDLPAQLVVTEGSVNRGRVFRSRPPRLRYDAERDPRQALDLPDAQAPFLERGERHVMRPAVGPLSEAAAPSPSSLSAMRLVASSLGLRRGTSIKGTGVLTQFLCPHSSFPLQLSFFL